MTPILASYVINTPDPPALADFYRALLGWTEVSRDPEWVRLRSTDAERPGLSFQLEENHVPPVWPTQPEEQRMHTHLDIQVIDLHAEVTRATELGATVAEHQPQPDGIRVMRDPHGHLFCLFLPGY
jgi:catechol 2,3-dioxygenase-like lactoylglutathione lyase family enzyme